MKKKILGTLQIWMFQVKRKLFLIFSLHRVLNETLDVLQIKMFRSKENLLNFSTLLHLRDEKMKVDIFADLDVTGQKKIFQNFHPH